MAAREEKPAVADVVAGPDRDDVDLVEVARGLVLDAKLATIGVERGLQEDIDHCLERVEKMLEGTVRVGAYDRAQWSGFVHEPGFEDFEVSIGASLGRAYLHSLIDDLATVAHSARSTASELGNNDSAERQLLDSTRQVLVRAQEEMERLRSKASKMRPVALRKEVDAALAQLSDRLMAAEDLVRAVRAADRAADAAESAAQVAVASASEAGTGALAEHFEGFSEQERSQALWWRIGSFFALAITLAAAVFHIGTVDTLSTSEALQKLAIGLPLAALFGITTYEANLHRNHAMWASHIVVQMKSLRAFTEDFNEGSRDQVRLSLALKAFAGPPSFGRTRGSDEGSEGTQELNSEAIATIVEAISERR